MPSCLFVLSRLFLRVDDVLFRIYDARLYHAFGRNEVIREEKGRQNSYAAVKEVREKRTHALITSHILFQRLPSEKPHDLTPLTDSNWVANVLGMLDDLPAHLQSTQTSTAAPSSPSQYTNVRTVAPAAWLIPTEQTSTAVLETKSEKSSAGDWKGLGTRLQVLHLA